MCHTITPVEILPTKTEIQKIVQQVESGNVRPDALDENSYRLYALKDRQAPARCLSCEEHDFDILPTVEKDPERARSRTPIRTGLVHKNCGGQIYGDPFGPNFFMGDKLPERIFTVEGIEIT
ncbi:MAG: hypothetical protein CL666_10420 [Balneola sp.]|nr:hypothetical protein [Balneola sp.]